MKLLWLLLAICLILGLVTSIETDPDRRLINRPKIGIYGPKQKRSPQSLVKGGVKVHSLFRFTTPSTKEVSLRKGEYMCGNKVCKLTPGVVPKGCEGHICQYPIL